MPKVFGFASFILSVVEIKSIMLPSISTKANVPTIRLIVKVSHEGCGGVCKDTLLIDKMLGKFGKVLELPKEVLLGFRDLGVVVREDVAIRQPRLPREVGAGIVVSLADFFLGDFGLVAH
jgi:hypothetical protein